MSLAHDLEAFIAKHGPWTAHNIRLADDVYTMGKEEVGSAGGVRRFLQLIVDITDRPLAELRVLDLGCLEGLYALEAARHGARVVAIDARQAHIDKCNFAKRVLGLEKAEFFTDDVRNISVESRGTFDVILCVGLLYHLEAPDVFALLKRMREMCTRCCIIETHLSLKQTMKVTHNGHDYWGSKYVEHPSHSTPEERAQKTWASIDNVESFWPTKISLLNALSHAGFTSVCECRNPPMVRAADRCTLVAINGKPHDMLLTSPLFSHQPSGDWDESEA